MSEPPMENTDDEANKAINEGGDHLQVQQEDEQESRSSTPIHLDLAHLSSVIITSSEEGTNSTAFEDTEHEYQGNGSTTSESDVDASASGSASESEAEEECEFTATAPQQRIPLPCHDGERTYFAWSDTVEGAAGAFEPLTGNLVNADITIAPDSSYVETTDGSVARELKRRYDQRLGVNKDVRSPYAITSFTNQHGNQRYRVEHRDMNAPGAAAAAAEDQLQARKASITTLNDSEFGVIGTTSSGTLTSESKKDKTRRPSRMSVHALPQMFRGTGSSTSSFSSSRPQTTAVHAAPANAANNTSYTIHGHGQQQHGPRKLRKTKSIPDDLRSAPKRDSAGRGHSNSVTSADIHAFNGTGSLSPPAPHRSGSAYSSTSGSGSSSSQGLSNTSFGLMNRKRDAFADAMEWNPSSRIGSSSSSSYSHSALEDALDIFPLTGNPFGQGVAFSAPGASKRQEDEVMHPRHHLRVMQSFESGLTARQDDEGDHGGRASTSSVASSTILGHKAFLDDEHELNRPISAIRLRDSYLASEAAPELPPTVTEGETLELDSESMDDPPQPPPAADNSSDISGPKLGQEVEIAAGPALPPSNPEFEPNTVTAMHSRFSNEVFDVLQTYRGIPQFDTQLEGAGETVKLSLAQEDSAAPRDDPRFVIWGELRGVDASGSKSSLGHEESMAEFGAAMGSPGTPTRSSSTSRRKSRKGKGRESLSVPQTPSSTQSKDAENKGERVMLAATIERWIAQLTSDLDYDHLLDFFLTYRTYISAEDLCDLLIARFHWALSEPQSAQDERVRSVVRVRTFVALQYWIVTFFTVDFIPNRELRLLLASWLNSLIRDPILKKHRDGLKIVQKLRKVVKSCRDVNTPLPSDEPRGPKTVTTPTNEKDEKLFGEEFARATRKIILLDEDEEDIDLDFIPDEQSMTTTDDRLSNVNFAALSPKSRTSNIPLSSLAILQRTEPTTDAGTANEHPHSSGPMLSSAPGMSLPLHHGTISRVIVKTMGRLGRWRRVLNNRAAASASVSRAAAMGTYADVSAFDVDMDGPMNGGRFFGNPPAASMSGQMSSPPPKTAPSLPLSRRQSRVPRSSISLTTEHPASPKLGTTASAITLPASPLTSSTSRNESSPGTISVPALTVDIEPAEATPTASQREHERPPSYASTASNRSSIDASSPTSPPGLASYSPEQAFKSLQQDPSSHRDTDEFSLASSEADRFSIARTSSTDSFGRPLSTAQPFVSPYQFDVVSIDQLTISSNSSDENLPGPPGLHRPARRLPTRKEFEFARRPETVSSLGGITSPSRNSAASASSAESDSGPPPGAGGGVLHQWQLNALMDTLMSDDEEIGDQEAALRRLEGQLDPKTVKKANGADEWLKQLWIRQKNGNIDNRPRRFSDDSADEEEEEAEDDVPTTPDDTGHVSPEHLDVRISVPSTDGGDDEIESVRTPLATHSPHFNSASMSPRSQAKASIDEAIPIEILESRLPSQEHSPAVPVQSLPRSINSKPSVVQRDPPHRSFIHSNRAELLAQHFAVIDRELFMGVKFEELVTSDWSAWEGQDVYDWMQYLKDRATWKAGGQTEKTTAVAAVRARFNLMANFVISEVVLSHPHDRASVVAKFLRIAWKSYAINSYNTLVAIVFGLKSHWVDQAMSISRSWSRLPMWEARVFNDLKQWTTSADCFRYLRRSVEQLENSDKASSHIPGSSDVRDGSLGGIPFIGQYLSQLHQHNTLPDLIDPTALHEPVSVDAATNNYAPPAHPEVFASLQPLPAPMTLEPLINIHKQRLIARVIKSLVAGQHLASRLQYPIDKKLFQKCLRLRSLDQESVQQALNSRVPTSDGHFQPIRS